MKAIVQDRYGPAEVLEPREIELPTVKPDQLLIRVRAAGVDRGVWHLMTGRPYAVRLAMGLRRPRNPVRGMDVAGVVEAVGASVTGFAVGDEVFGTGTATFAEYATAGPGTLAPKPAGLSFEQAAAVPISATTALRAVHGTTPGQRVLILGASGGVGTYAVQLAKSAGAEVTAVCGPSKVDLVRSLGADHVVDYTTTGIGAAGSVYDRIIDIAGNRTLKELRRVLAPRGTLLIVGGEGRGELVGAAMTRTLRAVLGSPLRRQRLRGVIAVVGAADLRTLTGLSAAGKFTPALDRTFPLDEAAKAVRYLEDGHVRGKIVLTV